MKGKGVKFERIRRITGYLVGTVERFNDAKRAEEKDRSEGRLARTVNGTAGRCQFGNKRIQKIRQ